jgi:hypothetical protein
LGHADAVGAPQARSTGQGRDECPRKTFIPHWQQYLSVATDASFRSPVSPIPLLPGDDALVGGDKQKEAGAIKLQPKATQ